MPRRKTHYNPKWENEVDVNGSIIGLWCTKNDEFTAKCSPCGAIIQISVHGISALRKHAGQKNHKKKVNNTSQPSTSAVIHNLASAVSSQPTETEKDVLDEQIRTAEAIWCAMVCEHDLAFLMSDHLAKNLFKMCPDSAIAAGFKCARTKTNYLITHGLAPDIQDKLISKLKDVPFALMIDESNKQYGKRFLVSMVKFFDKEKNQVSERFLDVSICNKGSSDDITQQVAEMFVRNQLNYENLIHIMTDNPNVMRGKYTGVVKQITSKYANHVVDIGGCSLHHVANSVKNSLPELHRYEYIEDFMQDTSTFFTIHVEFAESFSCIQEVFDIEQHRLLKYYEGRFLSAYPVVERLLEQYKALKKLFLEEIPNNYPKVNDQKRVGRICENLRNIFTLPTLHFIMFVLLNFQKYEKLFQREEPTIHLMYDKQVDLYRSTLMHFCVFSKIETLKNSVELVAFDYKHKDNLKPIDEISLGVVAKKLISHFSQQDKMVFLSGAKRFFIKISGQLLKNLSLKNKFLSNLRFLKPEYRVMSTVEMITNCAYKMPPVCKLSTKDIDALSYEWNLLVLEDLPVSCNSGNKKKPVAVDKYWRTILDLMDCGEVRYPIIGKVVRFALSIAEANGTVERLFSQLFHIIRKDRNRLETHTIKGILTTKSYLQNNETCMNLRIDESMMYHIKSAYSKYSEMNLEKNESRKEDSLEKRLQEEVHKERTENKKLKSIENKQLKIDKQVDILKANEIKAMSLLSEAKSLMENSHNMSKQIDKEKQRLQEEKAKIEGAVLKATCNSAARNIRLYGSKKVIVDVNNNRSDPSDSD